jgi:hypothetical protein
MVVEHGTAGGTVAELGGPVAERDRHAESAGRIVDRIGVRAAVDDVRLSVQATNQGVAAARP